MGHQRFYWLDLIRFIAAFLVVAVHVRCDFFLTYSKLPIESQNLITQIFYYINSFGFDAVLVFFVLSGFLVGGRNLARLQQGNDLSVKQYIIDRFFRIGVPLIASLILIIFVDLLVGKKSSWVDLFGNLLGLQGILVRDAGGVFWTLAYEIWFYVFICALLLIFKNNQRKILGLFLLAISLVAFIGLQSYFLFILSFGTLAYYLKDFLINRIYLLLLAFLWIALSTLSHFAAPSKARDVSIFSWVNNEMLIILMGIIIAILISQIVYSKPKTKFGFRLEKAGTFLASFSYTLYLTHYQVLRVLHFIEFPVFDKVTFSTVIMFGVLILICMIFAFLFYQITEKQTDKIKCFFKNIVKL